ncbi:MAG: HD-GYP domain-containing protein [Thermodesulfobacteriota bacterium]|nr:HD-GYP domain-containing protein [Thermodesulfobacteriota bacterium]
MDLKKEQTFFGEDFLRLLYRLIQSVKIHQDNNQLLLNSAKEFNEVMAPWWVEEESLMFSIHRDRFYLEEEKLLFRRENVSLIQEMLDYFRNRNLQGLRFLATIKDTSYESILSFIRTLNKAEEQEDPLDWLVTQLSKRNEFSWIQIEKGRKAGSQERDLERKELTRRTYFSALTSLQEVSDKLSSQKNVGVRKIKRIIQNMIDILTEDESILLSVSTIRDYDDYTYVHSVNVAILSLCLGKRVGLSKLSLRKLGICGLLHDLGKVDIPLDILNKPGRLTDEEFKEIEKHPLRSVKHIIQLKASHDFKVKSFLPPFEHHLKFNLSGYPRLYRKKSQTLLGRIITIADVFDALTSHRIYRPAPFSPDRALEIMLEKSGEDYDPIILKVFVNMLGRYPMGTLLKLDTGELALVVESPQESDKTRPRVVLLSPDGKGKLKKGKTVSLEELDPQKGSYLRNINKSFHPSVYGIQSTEFLF